VAKKLPPPPPPNSGSPLLSQKTAPPKKTVFFFFFFFFHSQFHFQTPPPPPPSSAGLVVAESKSGGVFDSGDSAANPEPSRPVPRPKQAQPPQGWLAGENAERRVGVFVGFDGGLAGEEAEEEEEAAEDLNAPQRVAYTIHDIVSKQDPHSRYTEGPFCFFFDFFLTFSFLLLQGKKLARARRAKCSCAATCPPTPK
jgi:hypothetical protein